MKSCCNYKWNMYTKAYGKQTWMILFLFIGQCFCAVSISQSNMITNKGGIINLVATTDEAGVTWTYKGGTSLTICSTGSAACIPTSILEMNFSANSSSATIAIASLNCSIHSGTYIASTTLDMASLTIDVTTPVSSISSKTSLTTSKVSSQELLVEVQCVYPKSAIAANFTVHRTGKPVDILIPDSKEPNTSYSGCECFEETYIVKKTITASQYPNEVVTIKANVGQLPTLDIGDVHFTSGLRTSTLTSTTEQPEDKPCFLQIIYISDAECTIAVVGIVIGLGLLLLCCVCICRKGKKENAEAMQLDTSKIDDLKPLSNEETNGGKLPEGKTKKGDENKSRRMQDNKKSNYGDNQTSVYTNSVQQPNKMKQDNSTCKF